MNIILQQAIDFKKWFYSPEFTEDLMTVDLEELVFIWADKYEIDLGDHYNELVDLIGLEIC